MRCFPVLNRRALSAALFLVSFIALPAADLDKLREAARRGDQPALHQLVEILGKGDAKAQREAFSWYKDIARAGDLEAALNVARAYTRGEPAIDLEADRYEAEEFYHHALKKSDDALPEVFGFYNSQRLPAPQYHKFALERLLARAQEGNEIAQLIAAQTYMVGAIVPVDKAASRDWLQKAYDQGGENAKMMYAQWQVDGIVLTQNPTAGMKIFTDLADKGSATAAYYVGAYYQKGEPVTPDPVLAAKYFKQAAEAGVPEAQFAYAKLLAAGTGVPKNPAVALFYWDKLADTIPEAAYNAGLAHRDGNGTTKNPQLAAEFFQLAKENGFEPAAAALAEVQRSMPTSFLVRDQFLLDEANAVANGANCYIQAYSYTGKAGDELTVEVVGRLYDTIHVRRTETANLRLLVDEGDGKYHSPVGSLLKHSLRLKRDGRVAFVVTTQKSRQTGDAQIEFKITRPSSAGVPSSVLRHTGTDHTLNSGDWNVLTLNTNGATDPLVLQVVSSSFDPVLEVGPAVSDANNFQAALWDDNSGGGTTPKLTYDPGQRPKFMIKVHDNDDRQGGIYRVLIDRQLHWGDPRF